MLKLKWNEKKVRNYKEIKRKRAERKFIINMKYLLAAINAKYIHSNLAVYDLKAYAKEYQDQIEITEYTINQNPDEILKDIYRKKPDFIAYSCYIWNICIIEQLIKETVKILPNTELWLGGPEASYRAEELMQKYSFLKGIMIGEGEETFYQLLKYYEEKSGLEKVQSIMYREKNEIKQTKIGALLDLSSVPFPYQNLSEFENRIIYYESSRGCPFSCSYCLSSIDKKLRFRELELVKKELQFFLDKKVAQVKFVDRTFNCKKGHAFEIWQYILEHDNGITNFHFEISADLLTEEELKLIQRMRPGLIQLEIGVQSTNPETLKAIHRTVNLEILKKNVASVHTFQNTHQHLDLIAGLPQEDYVSFQKSFNEVYKMQPDQLQLGFLKVLAGTQIWEHTKEYEIVYQDMPPYEVLYTKWISYEEILILKGVEQMVEVYYNSLQFVYSVAYLVPYFKTPFSFYQKLADYYEKNTVFEAKHSRMERFLLLLHFAQGYLREEELIQLKEKMVYDLYLRENAKSRPSFVAEEEGWKEQKRDFYIQEAKERKYLPNYQNYDGKQLAKMTHLEKFSRNPVTNEKGEVWILFDYKERNPFTYAAKAIEINDKKDTGSFEQKIES